MKDFKKEINFYFGGDGKKANEVTDKKSKEYFINWLIENGVKSENIIETTDFSHIDVVAQTKKGLYGFELKKRWCDSSTYPDAMLDGEKYDYIVTCSDDFKQGTDTDIKTFLVSFYTNGKMFIWDLKKSSVSPSYRPQHTEVSGQKNYVQTLAHHYNFADGFSVSDEKIKLIYTKN